MSPNVKCYTLNLLAIKKLSFLHRFNTSQKLNQLITYFYLVEKKLTTLVRPVSFLFVTLGFALESFLLVLLRGNAKIVSKALVPPAVYKALRVFMSRRYVTGTFPFSPYQNYHISVSIRKSAKRAHCTRAAQECCIMTD